MPVDRERGAIFVHVPKTGGSSIEQMFGWTRAEYLVSRRPIPTLTPPTKTPQHFTWRELARNLPREFLDTAYTFAFVRNPWDRFVSEYCWRRTWFLRNASARAGCCYDVRDVETLDDFVRVLELPECERLDAVRGFDGHLETQLSFVVDDRNESALDFLGRFETFEADARCVAAALGIRIDAVARARPSDRAKDYRPYYSSYSRAAVADFYRADIEAFGYSF